MDAAASQTADSPADGSSTLLPSASLATGPPWPAPLVLGPHENSITIALDSQLLPSERQDPLAHNPQPAPGASALDTPEAHPGLAPKRVPQPKRRPDLRFKTCYLCDPSWTNWTCHHCGITWKASAAE